MPPLSSHASSKIAFLEAHNIFRRPCVVCGMRRQKKNCERGQTITECMVTLVIVAIAAIVILGTFSDRFRVILAAVICKISPDNQSDILEATRHDRSVRRFSIDETGDPRADRDHWEID